MYSKLHKIRRKTRMKLKKYKRTEKGITLIALVITIIVLLILAGVSIATLTGDNGILTQANNSKMQTEIGEEKEKIGLAWQSLIMERESKNNTNPISDIELKNQLVADGEDSNNVEVTGGTGKLTVKYKNSGNLYTISQDGKIENGTDTGNEYPPVPNGFYLVEGTTEDEGFVISDVQGDDLNNSKGGNQFVWIPVDDINVSYQKWCTGGVDYNNSRISDDILPDEIIKKLQKWYNSDEISTENLIKESILKYKGFYIARYDAGIPENSSQIISNDVNTYNNLRNTSF